MADLQSVFGSINITTDDKNKYLRVDNNYNPSWESITQESIGDSWVYTQFSKPTIVNLPKLSDSIGGIVAVMRNDASLNTPAYIALRPYDLSEQIMGKEGCWVNIVEDENFASVVLKAVNYIDDTGKTVNMWTIVNGVNTWEQVAYDISSVPEFASAQDQNIFVQKIGANALSGGVGASGVEYKAISSTVTEITEGETTTTIPSSFKFYNKNNNTYEDDYLTPYNSDPTLFVVGKLGNDQSSANWKYINTYESFDNTCIKKALGQTYITSIGAASFNTLQQCIFGLNLDSIKLSDNTALTSIDKLYLYIEPYADTSKDVIKMFKTDTIKETSDGTNYGQIIPLSSNGSAITTPDQTNIGSIVSVPISESDITNNKITFVIEIASSDGLTDAKAYIKFKLIGVEQSKSISVSPDIDFANFSMVNCRAIGTYKTDKTYENQYIGALYKKITGTDKDTLVKYGASTVNLSSTNNSTDFTSTFTGISPIRVIDTSGKYNVDDYNTIFDKDPPRKSLTDDDIKIIDKYNVNTLFDNNGNYIPDKSVTKTVIEYKLNGKLTSQPDIENRFVHLDNARLEIDWNSKTFIFNGTLFTYDFIDNDYLANDYLASLVGKFNDSNTDAYDVVFYNQNSQKITLEESLQISALTGLTRLPYCYAYGTDPSSANQGLEFQLNITNYKTVYKNENLNIKYFDELIHYRCGWERAETAWTDTLYTDGSEIDLLVGNDHTKYQSGIKSPSKLRIKPAHKRWSVEKAKDNAPAFCTNSNGQIVYREFGDRLLWPDTNYNTYKLYYEDAVGLLPYVAYNRYYSGTANYGSHDSTEAQTQRYFSCAPWNLDVWNNSQFHYTEGEASYFRANPFVMLDIEPTITGTLFCKVKFPASNRMSDFNSLIIREDLPNGFDDNTGSTYHFIADNHSAQDDGTTGFHDISNWTDFVEAGKKYRYHYILYTTVYCNHGNYGLTNRIISRTSNVDAHFVNDFKTFYDNIYYGEYGYGRNIYRYNDARDATMRNVFFGYSMENIVNDYNVLNPKASNYRSVDSKTTPLTSIGTAAQKTPNNDGQNNNLNYSYEAEDNRVQGALDLDKFTKLMFNANYDQDTNMGYNSTTYIDPKNPAKGTQKASRTTPANMGSGFEFHAYVIKSK